MSPTLLLRGAHVHTLEGGPATRALALEADRVAARAEGPGDLDHRCDPGTTRVDLPDLCVLPGFGDAHVHQLQAEQDLDAVDLRGARRVDDVVRLVAEHAARTPAGRWVAAQRGWHESRLAERRLPTTAELDRATRDRPVLLRRGSHLAVLNTAGLERAGAAAERDAQGRPTGFVRGMDTILDLLGDGARPGVAERAAALARVCAWHASRGLVGVREAGISVADLDVYEHLAGRGELTVRTDVMIMAAPELGTDGQLALLDELGPPPGQRGQFLRIDGIKLLADGRVEDAALREPYEGRPDDRGVLHADVAQLAAVVGRAVALGWRVGCHVVGDRALDVVLDAYERVGETAPGLPAGWLAVEHALLADAAQRRRTAALGVGVTVQHPLLDAYAGPLIEHWGEARAAAASPVRGWLDAGALVAAGSDGHVAPFDPLRSLWGLATRGTADAGVLGADQAVPLEAALRLYSVAAHWLTGWRTPREAFAPGAYADFVAFPRCVLAAGPEALVDGLAPVLTVVGGRASHDPHDVWPA